MAGAAGIAIEVGVAARAPLAVWPLDDSNRCFQLSSTVERSRRYCWYSSSSSQLLTPISGPDFDAMGRENAFLTMIACGAAQAEAHGCWPDRSLPAPSSCNCSSARVNVKRL